jgi:hypothetical protein
MTPLLRRLFSHEVKNLANDPAHKATLKELPGLVDA